MPKAAVIQMSSGTTIGSNLMTAKMLIQRAVDDGAKVVVLPENFALMGTSPKDVFVCRETHGVGRIQDFLAKHSKRLGVWIIAGTVPLVSEHETKAFASTIVWNDKGDQVARYDKIHLFDAKVSDSGERYKESDTFVAGNKPVVVDTPIGKIGLTICYDLRFPELYRELRKQGAEIFTVPSAFVKTTGMAHWRALLRARAIENQCYVLAPDQTGIHENGRETYGHSAIVDPWGEVLNCREVGIGSEVADIDLEKLHKLRGDFQAFKHAKLLN